MTATKQKPAPAPVDREALLAERQIIDAKLAADLDVELVARRRELVKQRAATFLQDDPEGKRLDSAVIAARENLTRLIHPAVLKA